MKKIALCFLTYGNLSQPQLWSRIINENKDKLNVYIHNKNNFIDMEYNLERFCIKNKEEKTAWGHISLVRATLKLFEEAYKNEENEFFILLSDKCIPLYNFEYIYNEIFSINQNILHGMKGGSHDRYDFLYDKEFISREHMQKHSQWIVLNRKTTSFFLETDYTSKFGEKSKCPDEHYFLTIMNKFKIPFSNRRKTYDNFKENSDDIKIRQFPKTYDIITNEMIYNIVYQKKLFFMRKVSDKCVLPSYFESIK